MSKTHTGDITNKAKRLARWMQDVVRTKGPASLDVITISDRIEKMNPHLTVDERTGLCKAALAVMRRDFPNEHTRLMATHIGFKDLNPTF